MEATTSSRKSADRPKIPDTIIPIRDRDILFALGESFYRLFQMKTEPLSEVALQTLGAYILCLSEGSKIPDFDEGLGRKLISELIERQRSVEEDPQQAEKSDLIELLHILEYHANLPIAVATPIGTTTPRGRREILARKTKQREAKAQEEIGVRRGLRDPDDPTERDYMVTTLRSFFNNISLPRTVLLNELTPETCISLLETNALLTKLLVEAGRQLGLDHPNFRQIDRLYQSPEGQEAIYEIGRFGVLLRFDDTSEFVQQYMTALRKFTEQHQTGQPNTEPDTGEMNRLCKAFTYLRTHVGCLFACYEINKHLKTITDKTFIFEYNPESGKNDCVKFSYTGVGADCKALQKTLKGRDFQLRTQGNPSTKSRKPQKIEFFLTQLETRNLLITTQKMVKQRQRDQQSIAALAQRGFASPGKAEASGTPAARGPR